jgi:hypothetical protein
MKRCLLLFLVMILTVGAGAQSGSTGIYMPLKCTRHTQTYIVTLSLKPICLANNPIVPIKDFESVSNLAEYDDVVYFDITFTPAGFSTLNKLNKSFPYTEMAFMIDQEVFITFNMANKQINRTFRIQGQWKDKEFFYRVYNKLEALMKPPN